MHANQDSKTDYGPIGFQSLHQKILNLCRPSKCLNHHNKRLCKVIFDGVNLLLQTYNDLWCKEFVAFLHSCQSIGPLIANFGIILEVFEFLRFGSFYP